jgi:predicted enzyme related to lactoylglutathione lyase
MTDRKLIPGKFVWFELVSRDAKKAQAFYAGVLGWRVEAVPMGPAAYEMIYVGDTMLGGYATPSDDRQPAHFISYVSVEDVDATARAAVAAGGRLLGEPRDIPTVGRMARIADPQGAALNLFRSATGDAPDGTPPNGGWLWNELHTSDPARALAFYEKVLGFAHRALDGGGGAPAYHIISRGGADRGGVTALGPDEGPAHWLPYVTVDDVDRTMSRARERGATVELAPQDIPGIGRYGVFRDPTGAALAIMKPQPRGK